MALRLSIPGRHSILTTAMTTAMLSSGEARVDSDAADDNLDRTRSVALIFPFLVAARAPPRNIGLTIRVRAAHEHAQHLFLVVARELCQRHLPATSSLKFITALSGSGAVLLSGLSGRPSPPLPLRTGRGSPREGRPLRCAWVVRRLIGDHLCFMQLPSCYRLPRVAFQHGTTKRCPISLHSSASQCLLNGNTEPTPPQRR